MNRGPWPNTRRWHSSCAATVSSASRRGEDEPPRERQVALARAAPPPAGRVADVTRAGLTASAGAWRAIASVEVRAGALAEPRLEDRRRWPQVARGALDEELVAVVAADAADPRPARAGGRGDDAHAMRLAAVRDEAAVVERGPPSRSRSRAAAWRSRWRRSQASRSARKSTTSPSGAGPAAAVGDGQRHDDATLRVDHDPEPARPRRAAERVREVAAGEARDLRGLRRPDGRPPSRAGPQQAAGARAGLVAVEDREPAAHDDVADPGRVDGRVARTWPGPRRWPGRTPRGPRPSPRGRSRGRAARRRAAGTALSLATAVSSGSTPRSRT